MLRAGKGLVDLPTATLKSLLAALHRKQLSCPITIQDLTRVGLQYCATDLLEVLRGLDEKGVRAVLVTVIAERMRAQEKDRR